MTLQEVVARFNTTPFLFAGSGITRLGWIIDIFCREGKERSVCL